MEEKSILQQLQNIKEMVDKQANDSMLWFRATTVTEISLQRELRKLHRVIKDTLIGK